MTVLRLHDRTAPVDKPPRSRVDAPEEPETDGVWTGLIAEFLDRQAGQRFRHYTERHAGYRWKPKLALVLPEDFSVARPAHRRDLSVALEVLASVMDHYNIEVVSDSPDAARLFPEVAPLSHEAVAACAGALVLLSRSLNDELSAIRPSRYVAADPCAYRINKKRIVFAAGGIASPFDPADEVEIARDACGRVSVFLDDNEEMPMFLGVLRRLRAQGLPLRIALSSRADEDFARRVHAAFDDDPRVEVHDPEPCGRVDRSEFQLSNDPIVLLTQPKSTLPRFLFHRGELRRVGASVPRRSDYYLVRGEESNAHGLLDTWLGRRDDEGPRPAAPHLDGVVEPLVSIVVPVHDRTTELIRLAHSIYEQDYPWIEAVFVAHGSPPETVEAIRTAENYLMKRRFRVALIELDHACSASAIPRDLGIRASSGDLICVLDADDWLDPGFFAFLRRAPWRDDTLYYPRKVYRDPGRATGNGAPSEPAASGLGTIEAADLASALRRHGNFLSDSGVCFARTLFDRAGGNDYRLSDGAALYLWWRSALAGARAEEHDGRVNLAPPTDNHERPDIGKGRTEEACELARGQELIPWL